MKEPASASQPDPTARDLSSLMGPVRTPKGSALQETGTVQIMLQPSKVLQKVHAPRTIADRRTPKPSEATPNACLPSTEYGLHLLSRAAESSQPSAASAPRPEVCVQSGLPATGDGIDKLVKSGTTGTITRNAQQDQVFKRAQKLLEEACSMAEADKESAELKLLEQASSQAARAPGCVEVAGRDAASARAALKSAKAEVARCKAAVSSTGPADLDKRQLSESVRTFMGSTPLTASERAALQRQLDSIEEGFDVVPRFC